MKLSEYRKGIIAAAYVAFELVNENVISGTWAAVLRVVVGVLSATGVVTVSNKNYRKVTPKKKK